MSKVISATVVNPNGKEDTCAYAVVDSKELYYLLSPVATLDNYTISFFIKAHANETLKIWYGEEYKEFEVTTSWQKVTWNFTAEWIDNVMLQFTEGEYYIYNTMLERGDIATDYSLSQADYEKMIKDVEETLNTKYAQLSIELDNITLEVSETSSKLGNVESSVKLMSDEIGLKVNKNGIIGAINLSSEQAQIKASKIDLVGAVTISSLSSDVTAKFDTLDSITVTDNNLTYIDGAKIYTGSITAKSIDIEDLFADTGFINALSTNSIIVGATNKADQALNSVNKTVKTITMHYLATTASSGVTTSTSGWTTTVQNIDATKKYLWTYQTITYVDNTTTNTSPVISGVYGNEGKDGADGEDGTNGVGVTSVIPLYYLKSNTTAPSVPTSAVTSTSTSSGVWTKSVPTYVANYTYFTCTQTQYTNGTYGWSTVVADNALTNANKTANTANSTANATKNTLASLTTTDNNVTVIDGGKIKTGSITADKIDVDDLFAQNITADGSITGVTLISGTSDDRYRVVVQGGSIEFQAFDTRGEGDWKVTGSLYTSSAGSVDGEGYWTFEGLSTSAGNDVDDMADDISALQTSIATINSNLDAGLPVDYDNLSYSDVNNKYGALVTTTKTEYSTLNNRKFNDYAYLCFELLINANSIRASIIIPANRFIVQGYTVELSYVDSSNVQRWVSVTYKSDTSFYMVGSSNIVANNTRVHITGLKAKKSFDLYTTVQ